MILAAFILDAILGDPYWMPHPVRFFGFLISRGEAVLRRVMPRRERLAGTVLTVFVTLTAFAVPFFLLFFLFRFNYWAGFVLSVFLAYQSLAARCLWNEAMKVYRAALSGDLEKARRAVSMIVGRDTDRLSMEGVTKAAVETVAESLSDGVIAPLFYLGAGFVLGGPPLAVGLAFFYKASNTLDSMIGYKNERYIDFGRTAAKLDDALNFVPARVSGILIVLAAALTGLDAKGAARVFRRDRKAHASPNAGHPEAACAGALGLALAGGAYYGGILEEKPVIGDGTRSAEPEDIRKTCKLMYVSALLFLALDVAAELAVFLAGRMVCT
jgi:adenosylcobinamide-phosphate synthase